MRGGLTSAVAVEAMLIRASAAHRLLELREVDGIDALRLILIPTEETLEASLAAAEEKGPTPLAHKIAGAAEGRRKRRPQLPRRMREGRSRSISLDDLLSTLS